MSDWNTFNENWITREEDFRTVMPPFITIAKAFSKDECVEFEETVKKEQKFTKGSTFANDIKNEKLSNRIVDVWTTMNAKIRKRIFDTIAYHNSRCWQYNIHDAGMEPIQMCVYHGRDRGHYSWHRDSFFLGSKPIMRKLSFSLLLSDTNQFSGGQLQLCDQIESDGKLSRFDSGLRNAGDICIFPSDIYHRVTPVTAGTRTALVSWIWGDRIK